MTEKTQNKRIIGVPFKEGNPGGPGRPRLSDEIKQAQRMSQEELVKILTHYHDKSIEELEVISKDKTTPASHYIVVRMILKAASTGNTDPLYDRLVGKVKQVVENLNPPSYAEQRLKEAEALLLNIFLEDKKRAIELEVKPGLIGENGNTQNTSEVSTGGSDPVSGEPDSGNSEAGPISSSEVYHRV